MTSECCYEDTVTTVADTSAVVYSAKTEVLKARKLQRERAPKARVAEALAPALVWLKHSAAARYQLDKMLKTLKLLINN